MNGDMIWHGDVTTAFVMTFSGLIKNHNGLYASDKQAEYMDSLIEDYDAKEFAPLEYIDFIEQIEKLDVIKADKYDRVIYLFGTYYAAMHVKVPVCFICVINYTGVVSRYKVKFEKLSTGTYSVFDVDVTWKRKED